MENPMWEILVPAAMNRHEVTVSHHRIWDEKVRRIAGGLTIYRSARGQWYDTDDRIYIERVIPVRISCSEKDLHEIMRITKDHYKQKVVCAYQVSNKVIFLNE